MVVVDASVVVDYFIASPAGEVAGEVLATEDPLAPHLIDAEVGSALRRLVGAGELDEDEALEALARLADLRLTRTPHSPLIETAWAMRSRLNFYDALYAALAGELDAELITADARLARGAGSFGIRARSL